MRIYIPRISITAGVGLGFLVILVLILVFTSVGLTQMSLVNARIRQLAYEDSKKIELAHQMKSALIERAVTMHVITLLSDPFEMDEEYVRLGNLADQFVKARAALRNMNLSAREWQILFKMGKLTRETQPLLVKAVNTSMEGNAALAQKIIKEQTAPAQRKIQQLLDKLIRIQTDNVHAAVSATNNTHQHARKLMGMLGGSILVLGIGIAFFVVRYTSKQAKLLRHQAMYDVLTNLPNRSLLADRLHQSILFAERKKLPFAFVAIDLDRFKEINDMLGHHIGDEVLQLTAQSIRKLLRESDTLARMGGDEFSIILRTAQSAEGAAKVAERILESLQQPMVIGKHEIEINASLGIALFPEHATGADELQRRADAAMYQAKRTHAGYVVFNQNVEMESEEEFKLKSELRRAIVDDELVLHYQPKIDFSSHTISGVEALVRWQHPSRGLLNPDTFIPSAEESGLIRPLTEKVLRMAARQATIWMKSDIRLPIAVNVSALNMQDKGFAKQVAAIIREYGLPSGMIELEITESAVMHEPEKAIDTIKQLQEIDVHVSIDDFGTGYTSMSQLKELLVAKIKIDRSFVKDMAVNHSDAVIVRTAVDLGHNLGFKVIAEGVEDQATWDKLEELGCDSAQGFHMSRPQDPESFAEWLNSSEWGLPSRDQEA